MNIVSGIYKIVCLTTNKIYIGSSYHCKLRWYDHKRNLKNKKHHNKYLQAAYNKYGLANFEFSLIEECDEDKLLIREQFWIDKFKSYQRKFGYNLCRYVVVTNNKFSSKKYKIVSPDGKKYIVNDLQKFCDRFNLKIAGLRNMVLGRAWTYKNGWHCRYANESLDKWLKKQKRHSKKGSNPTFWKINLIDGTVLIYKTLLQFSKDYKYSLGTINLFRNGKRKSYRNLKSIEKIPIDNSNDLNKWR
jgi:group I intron endonuclease